MSRAPRVPVRIIIPLVRESGSPGMPVSNNLYLFQIRE